MKALSTQTRHGQLSSISGPNFSRTGDQYLRIEVDVYEKGVDGYDPYLLEFYVYDANELAIIEKGAVGVGDWVTVKYKTESKVNPKTEQTYTTSTLVSISRVNEEEIENLNKAIL